MFFFTTLNNKYFCGSLEYNNKYLHVISIFKIYMNSKFYIIRYTMNIINLY